ncbi:MAG TPA: AI-2E family transporter [Blastocatellia bacterium]|nr:AI-2E family transporter [Blastocatellia bacterium]
MKEKQHENTEMIRLWTTVIVRVIFLLVSLVIVSWLIYQIRTLLLLLILSIFFCYLIAPIVRVLEQPLYLFNREIKLPRSFAILFVYVLMGGVLFVLFRLIWPSMWEQINELVKNMPDYLKSATDATNNWINSANNSMKRFKFPPEWRDYILDQLKEFAGTALPWFESLVGKIVGLAPYLTWLVLVPVLSFFLLKDASTFEQNVIAFLPNERMQKRAHWLLQDVSRTLAAYIRAQITACLVVGAIAMGGLSLIGAKYAIVLGGVAGVLEFVPMIGPLIAAVFIFGLTLTQSFKLALIVALFLVVLRMVQDYVIYPRIVGHGIKMHPLVVIMAILAGAEIGGLVGIFLSIPVVGLIMVFYSHYRSYREIQNLRIVVSSEEAESLVEAQLSSSASAPPEEVDR